jgi:8-oxo-dGTP pyrophosphatase MutT (NUDIX family)
MIDLLNIARPKSRQTTPESAQKVFTGEIFTVYQWPQTLYDGSTATFEKLYRDDTVGVLAITPDKKIVISEQEQPSMQPFVSLLGGVVDEGEKPFETAKRELLEEAGGTAENWDLWLSTQPMSKIDWAMYMFIARDCKLDSPQALDAGEKITLRLVSFEEFLKIVFQPEFRDFEVSLRIARMITNGEIENFKKLVLGE